MNTKELIAALQAADPSGELQVTMGNCPLLSVDRLPSYYDGSEQFFTRDEDGHINGAGYKREGSKVSLHFQSIGDRLWDRPDFPVDYSGLQNERDIERAKAYHDEIRTQSREIENTAELDIFIEHVKKRVLEFIDEPDELTNLRQVCHQFFTSNMSRDDPFPEDGPPPLSGVSYVDRRNLQWEQEIDISVDVAEGIKISRRENQ